MPNDQRNEEQVFHRLAGQRQFEPRFREFPGLTPNPISPGEKVGRSPGEVDRAGSNLPERNLESKLGSGSSFPQTESSFTSSGARLFRSIDLPVQRSLKPSFGEKIAGVDRAAFIARFNSPAPLEMPLANFARPKTESGSAGSESIFRQSGGSELQFSRTGNQTAFGQTVTHLNRAAEAVPPAESPAASGPPEKTSPDLKALARELLPFIKRMVIVERERLPY